MSIKSVVHANAIMDDVRMIFSYCEICDLGSWDINAVFAL